MRSPARLSRIGTTSISCTRHLIGAFPFAEAEYPEFVERMKRYICQSCTGSQKFITAGCNPILAYEDAYVSLPKKSSSPRRADTSLRYPFHFARESLTTEYSAPSRRLLSRSPHPVCLRFLSGLRSCRTSAWSIPTIAGRWILKKGVRCLPTSANRSNQLSTG